MKIKRILTIESVDDRTTRRMLKIIYGSSEFKDYVIDHFFFLKDTENLSEREEFLNRLIEKIEKFNPDYVLIHSGISFLKNKEMFLEVIPRIRKLYPEIYWGIQHRSIMDKDILHMLSNKKSMERFEKIFFSIDR